MGSFTKKPADWLRRQGGPVGKTLLRSMEMVDPVARAMSTGNFDPNNVARGMADPTGILGVNQGHRTETPATTDSLAPKNVFNFDVGRPKQAKPVISYNQGTPQAAGELPVIDNLAAPGQEPVSAVQKLQDRYNNLIALKAFRGGR